jgi:Spy/CpxP family protein refolding chaperone
VGAVARELTAARHELRTETFADKRDDARLASLATKVTTLEKQLFDLQLKNETAVADLLTPEQREKVRGKK